MATGTGKTLLCAALIRRFLLTRNAERVLFIVDRIELAKQTLEDFNVVLREFKPVIYKSARLTGELLGSSVVIRDKGWQLMPGRYKPVRLDAVKHDPPEQILTDVLKIEAEISARAKALQAMLTSTGK